MALKVLGWTSYDSHNYPAGQYTEEVRWVVLQEVKRQGYLFTGEQHQECINCAPVLNDGKLYRFSQRDWGDLMAVAHGSTNPMDYAIYSCGKLKSEAIVMPDNTMYEVVRQAAKKLLTHQEYDYLLEGSFTFRYPQLDLGDREIYTLNPEEHKLLDKFGIHSVIRQVPKVLYDYLVTEK